VHKQTLKRSCIIEKAIVGATLGRDTNLLDK